MKPLRTLAVLLATAPLWAEPTPKTAPSGDLLNQGLWWMYHLQYEKAYEHFGRYTQEKPEDPSGYFYQAASDWWHLAQEFDYSLPEVQKRFFESADKTIEVAKKASTSTDPKIKTRAYLYWGGAEGLRGRWLVTQRKWLKAYFAGKNGEHFLKLALKEDPTLYDAYMGLGIYDYFTDTMSGVVGALSTVFIRGDKKRGFEELQVAIEKGEHAQVEAKIFLIEIYTSEENQPEKALSVARELRKEFPLSPAMHLAEIMVLYTMKDWEPMMREAEEFRKKCEAETPWFVQKGERPALYTLGVGSLWGRHDPVAAMGYFNQILDGGIDSSRWVTFAFLRRGQILDERGERQKALEDYRRVLKRKDFWGAHREAKKGLSQPYSSK